MIVEDLGAIFSICGAKVHISLSKSSLFINVFRSSSLPLLVLREESIILFVRTKVDIEKTVKM